MTRTGKPAVVVVSATEYARLTVQAGAARGSLVDHPLGFPGLPVDRVHITPRNVQF